MRSLLFFCPIVFSACTFCFLAGASHQPALAATAAIETTANDLQQREIDLLNRRVTQSKQELDKEKVSRIVYQTQLEVAALRGFPVKNVVTYAPLTMAKLDEILETGIKRQFPGSALEHYIWFNRLFDALPPDFDLVQLLKKLTTEQVAGLYDPLTRVLFVRTDFKLEGPMGRMILAHEICHALQDQNSPLTELGVDDPNNADRALAILSIAEGDATLLMGEHLARFGNPFGILAEIPKMMMMDQQQLENAPLAIQRSLLFPYLEGMKFFNALDGRTREHAKIPSSTSASDEAKQATGWRQSIFYDPPESTEQIIHPEKYLARELPARIELPNSVFQNLETSSTSVLGEFGIEILLEPLLGQRRATAAAAGWNGDRVLIGNPRASGEHTASQTHILFWPTKWDTEADAKEFADALRDALSKRYGDSLHWSSEKHGNQSAEIPGAQFTIDRPTTASIILRGDWEKLP